MSNPQNASTPSAKIRILVIDDESDFTHYVKRALERTGLFEVYEEHRAAQGLLAALTFKPDLILIDVIMPGVDGGQVAADIRARASLHNVPIVFLTALVSEENVETHHGVLEGEAVIAKPVKTQDLIERILRALRETRRPLPQPSPMKARILVVDDEPAFTHLVKLNLETTGRYEVVEENLDTCALTTARLIHPDVILVDFIMPHLSGPDLIAQLKADERLRGTPVVLLTALISHERLEAQQGMLEEYPSLTKPVSVEDLRVCLEQCLKNREGQTEELSRRSRASSSTGSGSGG